MTAFFSLPPSRSGLLTPLGRAILSTLVFWRHFYAMNLRKIGLNQEIIWLPRWFSIVEPYLCSVHRLKPQLLKKEIIGDQNEK
jgi:hypothetical protein